MTEEEKYRVMKLVQELHWRGYDITLPNFDEMRNRLQFERFLFNLELLYYLVKGGENEQSG